MPVEAAFEAEGVNLGSNHKKNIHTIWEALRGEADKYGNWGWRRRQDAMSKYAAKCTGSSLSTWTDLGWSYFSTPTQPLELTPKLRNDFYVASVLLDSAMIKEAARFFVAACTFYLRKEKAAVVSGLASESYHSWPIRRGWTNADIHLPTSSFWMLFSGSMSKVAGLLRARPSLMTIEGGLRLTKARMANIAKQVRSIEDIAYVLRCMMLLRDITKFEKHHKSEAYTKHPNYRDRIVGKGVQESRDDWTKIGLPSRFFGDPSNSAFSRVDHLRHRDSAQQLYSRQGMEHNWDRLQGMSGSTLDYTNWLSSMGLSKWATIRIFQVNFAAWHFVAPDGLAHSQFESINLLLKKYTATSLTENIMAPIKNQKNLSDALKGGFSTGGNPDGVSLIKRNKSS